MRALIGCAVLWLLSPALAFAGERGFDRERLDVFLKQPAQNAQRLQAVPDSIPDFSRPAPHQLLMDGPHARSTRERAEAEPFWQRQPQDAAPAPVTVRFGPLMVQSGKGLDGKHHFANYSLDGVNVLGGSVSGSIDGRGAKVFLRWDTSR